MTTSNAPTIDDRAADPPAPTTVHVWGDNVVGQLGDGTGERQHTPTALSRVTGLMSIAAGSGHTLALTAGGAVLGWGRNVFGQLADGSTENRLAPVVSLATGVAQVAAGGGHSAVLGLDGRVSTFGAGFFGALGPGSFGVQPTPLVVEGLTDVTRIAVGGAHNLALTADGTVSTWGRDDHGQLGDGIDGAARPGRTTTEFRGHSFPTRPGPALVAGLDDVRTIAAGGGHSLAVRGDGSLWTWGFNDRGQLGDGGRSDDPTPRRVDGIDDVVAVAAGYHHTVVLLADGTLRTWGLNDRGQLGDGTREHRSRPVVVEGLDAVVAIAAGGGGTDTAPGNGGHSLAVRRDGSVWGWGFNGCGQLGIDGADSTVPARVPGIGDCRLIAAGGEIPPMNRFEENAGGGFTVALG